MYLHDCLYENQLFIAKFSQKLLSEVGTTGKTAFN